MVQPVCCPSRAEILTGRYLHNVRTSDGSGCMHVNESKVNPYSYAHYLNQGANYSVGYFGKHLNNCPTEPPAGFDCPTCYWFAYNGDTAPGGQGGGYYNSAFNDWDGNVAVKQVLQRAPLHATGCTMPSVCWRRAERVLTAC